MKPLISPVDSEEFAHLMEKLGLFEDFPKIAVAVSGGCDSLALTILANEWTKKKKGEIVALTVDHGIRKESNKEALTVKKWLAKYKINHEILKWKNYSITSGIQNTARKARYDLLLEWCREKGFFHLLLAHNYEDQFETFFMRLCKGSGLDGLTCMSPMLEMPFLRILRPFLNIQKDRLKETLQKKNQEWIEDPSNNNVQYTRTRFRTFLANEELSLNRLNSTFKKLGKVRSYMEEKVNFFLTNHVSIFPSGYCILNQNSINNTNYEILFRALNRILVTISGKYYTPRSKITENLILKLTNTFKALTCGGCYIKLYKNNILIMREISAIKDEVNINSMEKGAYLWDNRFKISFDNNFNSNLTLKKIGLKGWVQIVKKQNELKNKKIPAIVCRSLPSIWNKNQIICVPHLNYIQNNFKIKAIFYPHSPICKPNFVYTEA